MNVLLVSQCSKNALVASRRVLDQFAERCGKRTWQTHITEQGLATLRKLLKSTARRNTAVACHWIRGKNHTELLWIVGNMRQFSSTGAVPTHTTREDIRRRSDENDWHTLEDMRILAVLAGLFHDFGKANESFQNKIRNNTMRQGEALRHEWVSLRLFQAFVISSYEVVPTAETNDQQWLQRLAALDSQDPNAVQKACLQALTRDHPSDRHRPFRCLPPLARTVGWLILTHHRLPQPINTDNFRKRHLNNILDKVEPVWDGARPQAEDQAIEQCWHFSQGTPFLSQSWRSKAQFWAQAALQRAQLWSTDWLRDHWFTLHMARLSLMAADHHYSSLEGKPYLGDKGFPLFANLDPSTHQGKQQLDEHLAGVGKEAHIMTRMLPKLRGVLSGITRHPGFKKRSQHPRFRWQDKAYDLACSLRERSQTQGFFGINMASTGCGKTLANGRIMYGLADPNLGARFSIALGLRALTLQTGSVYREELSLGEDDLGILVGSNAVRQLFQDNPAAHSEEQGSVCDGEAMGSESADALMPSHHYVSYEGAYQDLGPLGAFIENQRSVQAKKLIASPILTCTIDYLINATEGIRGGKQIPPMLRLLTSDLVLDEPDDFGVADLPALTRLVHWAGMLGSRVLLSSATLPPAMVEGLFEAYKAGREVFCKDRGDRDARFSVCCAWFDEYQVKTADHAELAGFQASHQAFIDKRVPRLQKAPVTKMAEIQPVELKKVGLSRDELAQNMSQVVHERIQALHQHHHEVDPQTGKRVSFGLVRFAHIDDLIGVARHLVERDAPANMRLKLCCYHSHFPLLMRNHIETQLDHFLNRKQDIFQSDQLRQLLTGVEANHVIFVILASPVAEVGRDHDYDWALVEPSSMRSIIQLAGRVQRHRQNECHSPNIELLSTNCKSLRSNKQATYCRPGFESCAHSQLLLQSKDLRNILNAEQYETINSIPRIQERAPLEPQHNLADLEHAHLRSLMLNEGPAQGAGHYPVEAWWTGHEATLTGFMQRKQPFRKGSPQVRYGLLVDEDDENAHFYEFDRKQAQPISVNNKFPRNEVIPGVGVDLWNYLPWEDYVSQLTTLAEDRGISLWQCSQQFGLVDLPEDRNDKQERWCYHPWLGIGRNA